METHCNCGCASRNHEDCHHRHRSSTCLAGFIHTQILEHFGRIENFEKMERQVQYETVVRLVRQLLATAGYTGLVAPSYEHEVEIVSRIWSLNPREYIRWLSNEGVLSPIAIMVVERMLTALENYRHPADAAQALNEIEGFVNGMLNLSSEERTALTIGAEVGKSSVFFFARAANDNSSSFHHLLTGMTPTQKIRINWADLIGGVVNCVGCGVAGGGAAGCIGCASISSGLSSTWFGGAIQSS